MVCPQGVGVEVGGWGDDVPYVLVTHMVLIDVLDVRSLSMLSRLTLPLLLPLHLIVFYGIVETI